MKKGLWNISRQLTAPTMAPQVGGQLFSLQHQIFKVSYFHNFSFAKNFMSPNMPKNPQQIYKKAQNIDMWDRWAKRLLTAWNVDKMFASKP